MYLQDLSSCHSEESKREVERKGVTPRNDGGGASKWAIVVFDDHIYRTRDFSLPLTTFNITEIIQQPILIVILSDSVKTYTFENGFDMSREHSVRSRF